MSDPLGLISNSAHADLAAAAANRARQSADSAPEVPFKTALMDQIKKVNELQVNADQAIDEFATGQRDDIENVMLATQKADTAFRMLLQVRNKVMEAYEEVKQIRV